MKIAILGATSQIAKDLVFSFSKYDNHDLALYARRPELVGEWLSCNALKGHFTVANFTAFSINVQFDAIFNFVGASNPAQILALGPSIVEITQKYDDLAMNYIKKNPECRYLFLSSGAVYGNNFDAPVDAKTIPNINYDNLQPKDWYGASKLKVECNHRTQENLPIIDIRVFNYFSHTLDMEARFLMTDIVRSIKNKSVLQVSDEFIVRDFIGPDEFYSLIKAVLSSQKTNIAIDCFSKAPVDKPSLLAAIQDSFGLQYKLIKADSSIKATGSKPFYYSLNKRASDYGYIPKYTSLENVLLELKYHFAK